MFESRLEGVIARTRTFKDVVVIFEGIGCFNKIVTFFEGMISYTRFCILEEGWNKFWFTATL